MKKKEVIEMSQNHYRVAIYQQSYLTGFQAVCNIVRQKLESCYNEDICSKMEELAQVAYMDLSCCD